MPSIISLATKLQADFPSFTFTPSDEFRWEPTEKAIFYDQQSNEHTSLLHEVSHAVLDHKEYKKDIKLIELEREAWSYALQTLAKRYNITISEDQIQDSLDTYRDWLHARSTCPTCHATGLQTRTNEYKCIVCASRWHTNDARVCALRRYIVPIRKIPAV
jgi:hypothetical protein